jgi:DnaJ-class molecular chaperone
VSKDKTTWRWVPCPDCRGKGTTGRDGKGNKIICTTCRGNGEVQEPYKDKDKP